MFTAIYLGCGEPLAGLLEKTATEGNLESQKDLDPKETLIFIVKCNYSVLNLKEDEDP